MPKTPLIVCIDVEPDARTMNPRDRADWHGFEKMCAFVRDIRAPLESATGAPAHFSWFLRMDPQVERVYGAAGWVMTRYGHLIRELQAAGDEMGLHPHVWRWHDERDTWIDDFGDPHWVARCVRQGFEAFEQCFGRPCRSVRLGDGWMDNPTMALVERLGARFDLTVEPGRTPESLTEPFTGTLPDYAGVPRVAYRPARRDFRMPGGWWRRELWEIPASTGRPGWAAAMIEEQTRLSARPHGSAGAGGAPPAPQGSHDASTAELIEGWAYDVTRPEAVVAVDIFEDETLMATVRADCFRPDLLEAGIGRGRHAFMFPLPDRLRDGRPHTIRVRMAGTNLALQGTPQVAQWPRVDAPIRDYVPLNLSVNPGVARGMFDAVLTHHRTPQLVLVVRSDAGSDPILRANLEQNFEHLLGHAETSSFTIATPPEAIDLLHS